MTLNLDIKFTKAFNDLSELEENLAPDIMLKLYAYYKQAVIGNTFSYGGEVDVRDAFKFNAWTQLNGMTQENAKKQYIKLVKNILNNQLK
ncbi:MAG: acyl-CoA-binding protein [Flavobacteriaceae bacterium]|nr:acyl-CoA-binding protein [Flavobacteriaceae bacterium]MDG2445102.1 acyl-CoA-binding protein [Flavobacteriaceae bacterium]